MSKTVGAMIREFHRLGVCPVVVASHPRSGTHLMIDTLRLNFPACAPRKGWGERLDHLYLSLDRLWAADGPEDGQDDECRAAGRLARRAARPVVKTHALADFSAAYLSAHGRPAHPGVVDWLTREAAWVYVYRDGRAALASLHRFLQTNAPEARVPFSEFLRQTVRGLSRPAAWAAHVRGWLFRPDACCVAMEDVLTRPADVIPELGRRLGLAPSLPATPAAADAARGPARLPPRRTTRLAGRLARILSRRPASTAIVVPGGRQDWRELMTQADHDFFRAETGDLLDRLGYEDPAARARLREPADRVPQTPVPPVRLTADASPFVPSWFPITVDDGHAFAFSPTT